MTAAVLVGRVGGLAAALGAGVVIGLSVAAPASAEPTDSRAGARSDSADSGVRASSGPRRGAGTAETDRGSTRSAPSAASVVADIDVPKATPARTPRATRGARLAADEPAAASAEPMPAAAAQKSRPAATAAAPVAVTPSAVIANRSSSAMKVCERASVIKPLDSVLAMTLATSSAHSVGTTAWVLLSEARTASAY